MSRALAPLLGLLAGCPGAGGETGPKDTNDENVDICAWIAEHSPAKVPEADQVVVYCEQSTDCAEATRLVTDEATLGDAEAACAAADELNSWERLPDECADDAGPAWDAVRCWRLD